MKTMPPRQEWNPSLNMLETELGNGWMVVEWFEIQNGRRVVAQLSICPAPLAIGKGKVANKRTPGERPIDGVTPLGGVTARLLRTIRVGQDATSVIADYKRWAKRHLGQPAATRVNLVAATKRKRGTRTRPKSARASDLYYAMLARDYVTLISDGRPSPTAQLARDRGESLERIRSHVHLARTNGFLSATTRGRPAGILTPKAERLLATGT
jgi:hypothetical protein